MMYFCGQRIVCSDAVFDDHIKVERSGIFCGRKVWPLFMKYSRNPSWLANELFEAYSASLKAGNSVQVIFE